MAKSLHTPNERRGRIFRNLFRIKGFIAATEGADNIYIATLFAFERIKILGMAQGWRVEERFYQLNANLSASVMRRTKGEAVGRGFKSKSSG